MRQDLYGYHTPFDVYFQSFKEGRSRCFQFHSCLRFFLATTEVFTALLFPFLSLNQSPGQVHEPALQNKFSRNHCTRYNTLCSCVIPDAHSYTPSSYKALFSLAFAVIPPGRATADEKYVFAHFIVCQPLSPS